ncbi:hypothetical protein N7540_011119 [Penicillium herquei]|nr:hypothetical protein N7540_011119 [Penicillium herquei]
MSYERPIPISHSPASKSLRVAILQALILNELVTNVFLAVPSYTLWLNPISPTPDWDKMAKEEPLQEAVMRLVSSVVYFADEQELEETRIANISDRITSKLRPLLIDIRSSEGRLQHLLGRSFDVWRTVQKCPRRIVALTDGKEKLDYPGLDIDEGIVLPGAAGADMSGTSIVLFPTISAIATSKPLHPGYVMRTSNPLYMSGVVEAEWKVKRARERG